MGHTNVALCKAQKKADGSDATGKWPRPVKVGLLVEPCRPRRRTAYVLTAEVDLRHVIVCIIMGLPCVRMRAT